jgi:hypothetical protein
MSPQRDRVANVVSDMSLPVLMGTAKDAAAFVRKCAVQTEFRVTRTQPFNSTPHQHRTPLNHRRWALAAATQLPLICKLGRRIGINQRTSTIPENDFSRRSDEPAGIVAVPTTAINRPV